MDPTDIRIETERLVLRLPRIEDFDRYAQMLGDEETARYIGGSLPRAAAWRRFLQMPGAWMVQGFAMFSIEDKATGRYLGQLGPWRPDGWPGNELGWTFHRDAWGHGYATEAGIAALDWAFTRLGWDDVIHCIDPGNVPSQRVAQRLGSSNRGPGAMPPPYEDHPTDIWGQTRAQWLEKRGAAT
jgi:RimJ/RimL family protein N-acetyltransferase